MKGKIQEGAMPVNNFLLQVVGLIPLTAIKISGIEDELEKIELPDRTIASSGNRKATEVTITTPMHHTAEQLAIEAWYKESQDPVSPTYKKPCTITHISNSGSVSRNFSLTGMFPVKRTLPDLDMENDTDYAVVEWMFSIDDVIPL